MPRERRVPTAILSLLLLHQRNRGGATRTMNRLQEKRLELGLTQPQVSARLKEVEARADVGMVSRYEKGVCLPTKDQLAALEELYGVPRTALYDVEDLDLLEFPRAEARRRRASTRPQHRRRATQDASVNATASAGNLRRACRTICSRCAGTPPGRAGTTQPSRGCWANMRPGAAA